MHRSKVRSYCREILGWGLMRVLEKFWLGKKIGTKIILALK